MITPAVTARDHIERHRGRWCPACRRCPNRGPAEQCVIRAHDQLAATGLATPRPRWLLAHNLVDELEAERDDG